MSIITRLNPPPAGFGKCDTCAYRDTSGTVAICCACAHRDIEALPDDACGVCQLPNADGCGNPICNDYPTRYFRFNKAVGYRKGRLQHTIAWYKGANQQYWAVVFARLLLGHLDAHREIFAKADLIVGSPTYVAKTGNGRRWDHIGLILDIANQMAEGRWPFEGDTRVLKKTKYTTPMHTLRSWKARLKVAEEEVYPALELVDPARVKGRRIVIFEDVFTDGLTINQIARTLVEEGDAYAVASVTLARQPFTPKPAAAPVQVGASSSV